MQDTGSPREASAELIYDAKWDARGDLAEVLEDLLRFYRRRLRSDGCRRRAASARPHGDRWISL